MSPVGWDSKCVAGCPSGWRKFLTVSPLEHLRAAAAVALARLKHQCLQSDDFSSLETFSFDHVFAARTHRHTRPLFISSTISSDCLLSSSSTRERLELELCQTIRHFSSLRYSTLAFYIPFPLGAACRVPVHLPNTHALMRCCLATSFTSFTT